MRIKDLMKPNVITVTPDTSVKHAARIMLGKGVSGLPVVDDCNMLAGMITEGDLLSRAEINPGMHRSGNDGSDQAATFVKSHGWKVGDVMTKGVIAVEEDATVGQVATLMDDHHIKRVPVTRDGRLIGIVSRVDLLRLIAMAEPDDCAPGDAAIRRSILSRLGETAFDGLVKLSVVVSDGVVHLWGNVHSTGEREAARAVSEGVRGVAGVVDHTRLSAAESRDNGRRQERS